MVRSNNFKEIGSSGCEEDCVAERGLWGDTQCERLREKGKRRGWIKALMHLTSMVGQVRDQHLKDTYM